MCHTIMQLEKYHFPEVKERESHSLWLMGFKRFVIDYAGFGFLHMHKAPIIALSSKGASITCNGAVQKQQVVFRLNITRKNVLETETMSRAALHVSPIEKLRSSSPPVFGLVVLFRPQDIVFFDGVDVSVKKVLIPRNFVRDFILDEQEFPLDTDKLNAIFSLMEEQFHIIEGIKKKAML